MHAATNMIALRPTFRTRSCPALQTLSRRFCRQGAGAGAIREIGPPWGGRHLWLCTWQPRFGIRATFAPHLSTLIAHSCIRAHLIVYFYLKHICITYICILSTLFRIFICYLCWTVYHGSFCTHYTGDYIPPSLSWLELPLNCSETI